MWGSRTHQCGGDSGGDGPLCSERAISAGEGNSIQSIVEERHHLGLICEHCILGTEGGETNECALLERCHGLLHGGCQGPQQCYVVFWTHSIELLKKTFRSLFPVALLRSPYNRTAAQGVCSGEGHRDNRSVESMTFYGTNPSVHIELPMVRARASVSDIQLLPHSIVCTIPAPHFPSISSKALRTHSSSALAESLSLGVPPAVLPWPKVRNNGTDSSPAIADVSNKRLRDATYFYCADVSGCSAAGLASGLWLQREKVRAT